MYKCVHALGGGYVETRYPCLWVCARMCVCTGVYVCTHVCALVCACARMCVCTAVYVDADVCVMSTHHSACAHVCMRTEMQTHITGSVCVCARVWACASVWVCAYVWACANVHAHTWTQTCAQHACTHVWAHDVCVHVDAHGCGCTCNTGALCGCAHASAHIHVQMAMLAHGYSWACTDECVHVGVDKCRHTDRHTLPRDVCARVCTRVVSMPRCVSCPQAAEGSAVPLWLRRPAAPWESVLTHGRAVHG